MKILCFILIFVFVIGCAFAAPSRTNKDIAQTKVINVVAEDNKLPVIAPTVSIVEDTQEVIQLREDMRIKPKIILFEYETPLGLGFSVNNLGICME